MWRRILAALAVVSLLAPPCVARSRTAGADGQRHEVSPRAIRDEGLRTPDHVVVGAAWRWS